MRQSAFHEIQFFISIIPSLSLIIQYIHGMIFPKMLSMKTCDNLNNLVILLSAIFQIERHVSWRIRRTVWIVNDQSCTIHFLSNHALTWGLLYMSSIYLVSKRPLHSTWIYHFLERPSLKAATLAHSRVNHMPFIILSTSSKYFLFQDYFSALYFYWF